MSSSPSGEEIAIDDTPSWINGGNLFRLTKLGIDDKGMDGVADPR